MALPVSSRGRRITSTRAPSRQTVISIRRSIASSTMSFWTAVAVTMVVPSSSTMMSPAWMPARSAGLPSTTVRHLHTRERTDLRGDLGGQRDRLAGDAEPGPANPARGHQGRDDLAGGRVDGDGEAEADPGHRGVDADHPAVMVGEDSAAVAGVERGVGLDDLVDDPAGRRGQRAAERGHDAGRDAAGQARAGCRGRRRAGRRAGWRRRPARPAAACRRARSRTARSDRVSRPTTSAVVVVPSVKVASAVVAPATTWALVSR